MISYSWLEDLDADVATMPPRQWRRAKRAEFARDHRRALRKKFPIYRSTESAVLMPRHPRRRQIWKGILQLFEIIDEADRLGTRRAPPPARRIPNFDIPRHCRAARR
jgi:hypothetical protein